MNIHHLELFFHVARHGGISAAARRMPYGIQQPAISSQILQLEEVLGVSLFARRPFALSAEGKLLYEFITPFFGGLEDMARRLRGGAMERLRIVAPALVQRDYLPDLLDRVKRRVPGFQFALRLDADDGSAGGGEFEVVLEILGGRRVPGRHCRQLGRLPLALLVARQVRVRSAANLWPEGRGVLPLITLADDDPVCRLFQTELRRREIIWSPALELANLDLVNRYVAAGYGVGLGLLPPGMQLPQGVEAVFLDDFPAVTLAISWAGTPSPAARVFIEEAELLAGELFGGASSAEKGGNEAGA